MSYTFYIKGLNTCVMRRQNVRKYTDFLLSAGYRQTDSPKEADYIIVWTCSFRADIRDLSLEVISDFAATCPDKHIVVTGCMPDIYPNILNSLSSTNITISPWKQEQDIFRPKFDADINFIDCVYVEENITDDVNRHRQEFPDDNIMFCDQFIKAVVSEGCNCSCSYCSERLAFPKYRSHHIHDIVEHCRRLIQKRNIFAIALMADSLGEFGIDTGESFIRLLHELCSIDDRVQIVLNNFHPKFFIKYFIELENMLYVNKLRHVNLPIQSASDYVLRKMNREYTKNDIARIFDLFNSMQFRYFDTHIIAGFPGETEEAFLETIDFLCLKKPAYVLASGYMESPLSGSAQLLPKVPASVIKERLAYAQAALTASGDIIVNSDGNELAKDRMKRVLCQGKKS